MVEAFSYEDIYEILRAEKFSTDLEEIKSQDLARIKAYLSSKKDLLKKQEDTTNILSSQKKIKIQQEIDNALRALKDLYEIRERKIINRAVYSTRTGSEFKDTTNMLENEVELYEQLLEILKDKKEVFFSSIDNAKAETSKPKIKKSEPESEAELKKEIEMVKVEFTEDCPEMFGEDLEKYGPFKAGDKADIPDQLCTILEKQEKIKKQ